MSLSKLVSKIEKLDDEWKGGSIEFNGDTASFQYKTRLSVADYEAIFMRSQGDEFSVMAASISRLVRDEDGSKLDIETLQKLDPDFVITLYSAIQPSEHELKKRKGSEGNS